MIELGATAVFKVISSLVGLFMLIGDRSTAIDVQKKIRDKKLSFCQKLSFSGPIHYLNYYRLAASTVCPGNKQLNRASSSLHRSLRKEPSTEAI